MSLRFHASAAHVRTARLVAVTVARRAGFDEDQVEGVRQAVGEACVLVVRRLAGGGHVTLTLDDEPEGSSPARLVVRVGPAAAPDAPDADEDMALAVLHGLTDDFGLETGPDGGRMCLTWTA